MSAGVVALFAGKGFLTSVGESVRLQRTSSSTLVVTLIAAEGLLATVGENVFLRVKGL